MMKYKISIITTLYNCQNFIEQSILSIINQSFNDFEWIIINDGSSDKTWDIVTKLTDKYENIIKIDNKDNKKIPLRRNEAISMASSEYVAIHDGDDISLPNRLLHQYSFFQKQKEDVFCVGGWALQIDENDIESRIMSYPPVSHNENVNMLLVGRKNPIIDPTSMFKKKIFKDIGMYTLNRDIYTVPDMDLWCRAILSGYKIINMPEVLIKYRINPNGMTRLHNKEMQKSHNQVINSFKTSMINLNKKV